MSQTDASTDLVAAIADLQEETALGLVGQRLEAGDDPLLLIKDCKEGLRQVGLRYERNEYYLAALIMGGESHRRRPAQRRGMPIRGRRRVDHRRGDRRGTLPASGR